MHFVWIESTSAKAIANIIGLASGDVVRVGRGAKVEMSLPDEMSLSEMHFMLVYDGHLVTLVDPGSESGTFVNGERVVSCEIDAATTIKAGEVEFAVLFDRDLGSDTIDTPITRLTKYLTGQTGQLFCLIDAARDEQVLTLLHRSDAKYMSLYQGESQKDLADVAPYLVQLDGDAVFLERLLRYGWGKRWFTFFTSTSDFADIRKHFRKFLFAKDENGETVYFRLYDPSVLSTFLPACSNDELSDVFGKIERFFVENEVASVLMSFSNSVNGLISERNNLST